MFNLGWFFFWSFLFCLRSIISIIHGSFLWFNHRFLFPYPEQTGDEFKARSFSDKDAAAAARRNMEKFTMLVFF